MTRAYGWNMMHTLHRTALRFALLTALGTLIACGGAQQEDREFFTSGDREADQRAEQRMVQEEQLQGGEETPKEKASAGPGGAAITPEQQTLYERLGGEQGLNAIVDDFVVRVLADPRVNWERKEVSSGGVPLMGGGESMEWQPTPANVQKLKRHLAQFFAVATAGPAQYDGRDMKEVHAGMQITNTEFDAAVGDLKATLDKLQIRDQEQKELLAIVESTREQVAEER